MQGVAEVILPRHRLDSGHGDKEIMSTSSTQRQFSFESFPQSGVVAYFSMEIAINPGMPTYSGGLGVLAGDTLRSAADLGTPLVAFTLP